MGNRRSKANRHRRRRKIFIRLSECPVEDNLSQVATDFLRGQNRILRIHPIPHFHKSLKILQLEGEFLDQIFHNTVVKFYNSYSNF